MRVVLDHGQIFDVKVTEGPQVGAVLWSRLTEVELPAEDQIASEQSDADCDRVEVQAIVDEVVNFVNILELLEACATWKRRCGGSAAAG